MSLDDSHIQIAEIGHEGYSRLVEYVAANSKHLRIEVESVTTVEVDKFARNRINNAPRYTNVKLTIDSPAGFNIGEQNNVFLGLAKLLTEVAYKS